MIEIDNPQEAVVFAAVKWPAWDNRFPTDEVVFSSYACVSHIVAANLSVDKIPESSEEIPRVIDKAFIVETREEIPKEPNWIVGTAYVRGPYMEKGLLKEFLPEEDKSDE